jgi:hypothetical protein
VCVYIPKFHGVGLGQDTLYSPSSKLARVVLHLRRQNGTSLAGQLGPPVECASGALGLVVELVQCLDGQVLVLAVDVVLHNCVEFCPDYEVQRLLVLLQGEIESAVPVCLGCGRITLDLRVVEGVLVGHVDLVGF